METEIETGTEAPAIRALGSLFKITQVFLWEDPSVDVPKVSSASVRLDSVVEEPTDFQDSTVPTTVSSGIDPTINGFTVSLEDMELVRQMNELGLPASFGTNKEKRTAITKKTRKSLLKKSSGHKLIDEQLVEVSRIQKDDSKQQFLKDGDSVGLTAQVLTASVQEEVCNKVTGVAKVYNMSHDNEPDSLVSNKNAEVTIHPGPLDAENFLENALQGASSGLDDEERDKNPLEVEKLEGYHIADYNEEAKKGRDDNMSEQVQIADSTESSQPSDHLDVGLQDQSDSCKSCSDLGDWRTVWDDFYMRNYFYNIRTHESTWYPPPGMEYFAFSDSAAQLGEMIADEAENDAGLELSSDDINYLDACGSQENTDFFKEEKHGDSLSCQPYQTIISSVENTTTNCMSCVVPPTTCINSMHLDELEGKATCFRMKKNSDKDLYPVHSHSFSDTRELVERRIGCF